MGRGGGVRGVRRVGGVGGSGRGWNGSCCPVAVGFRYEKLIAWQRADDLYLELHLLTKSRFPAEEKYELSAQLRRAAFSVAANIAEGFARTPGKDRLRFLRISWGSLAEVAYCVHVARRLGYVDEETHFACRQRVDQVGPPLMGLIRAELKRIRSL